MTIITTGKFDVLHAGHFKFIRTLEQLAGNEHELIIFLDRDSRIIETTGRLPVFSEHERFDTLAALLQSDASIKWFKNDTELKDEILASDYPRILVKGSEWKDKPIVGGSLCTVMFYDTGEEKLSSTEIKRRIIEHHDKYNSLPKTPRDGGEKRDGNLPDSPERLHKEQDDSQSDPRRD